jgi:carboxyl-terminal processing protease
MQVSKNNKIIFVFLIVVIIFISFAVGLVVGNIIPTESVLGDNYQIKLFQSTPEVASSMPQENSDLFQPFWQTWQLVLDTYVDQPVDQTLMMRGAINGMLEALGDQHTSYMDPETYREQNTPLQGEYEGIGAWVDITGEYLKIISPMPNSPAEKAGLKPDDVILMVNDVDMTGLDGNTVLSKILGPAGTEVKLTIQRAGLDEPFSVTISRQKIDVPSVEGEMVDDNIAYIRLYNFGTKTDEEFRTELKKLMESDPQGLILDLRNNGGGYLNTAIEIASEFIGDGPILYEEFGDGHRITYDAKSNGIATEIPMVVLVNEGSASASEIVAGAIQDYGRGQLIGVKTYGKGSVQNWIELEDEQGAVRITIARWLTPHERQINELGLTPDITIEFSEEDIAANRDIQLNKAIEVLSAVITEVNH